MTHPHIFIFSTKKYINIPFKNIYNKYINIKFNHSTLPNYNLKIKFPKPNSHLNLIFNFQKLTKYYKHSKLFNYSIFIPKYSKSSIIPQHTIPPYKSLYKNILYPPTS